MPKPIPAPHPGETIREDILQPLGMSVNQLAKAVGITAARLNISATPHSSGWVFRPSTISGSRKRKS
jgi:hypothetical protein